MSKGSNRRRETTGLANEGSRGVKEETGRRTGATGTKGGAETKEEGRQTPEEESQEW